MDGALRKVGGKATVIETIIDGGKASSEKEFYA